MLKSIAKLPPGAMAPESQMPPALVTECELNCVLLTQRTGSPRKTVSVAGLNAKFVISTTGPDAGVAVGVDDAVHVAVDVFEAVAVAVRVPLGVGVAVAVAVAVATGRTVGVGVAMTFVVPTNTGAVRSVVVPSPTWPLRFQPQQYASPTVVTPHVCANPAVRKRHVPPKRLVGERLAVVVPVPSWPFALAPQQ